MNKKKHSTITILIILLVLLFFSTTYLMSNSKIKKLEKQLKNASGDEKIEILHNLASALIKNSPDKAINYSQKALELALKQKNERGEVTALFNLGKGYFEKYNYKQSLEYFYKSLKIYKKIKDTNGIGRSSFFIGFAYERTPDYFKALQYYKISLKAYEDSKNETGMAWGENSIGAIHEKLGNYQLALKYYLKSTRFFHKVKDKFGIAWTQHNIGNTYFKMDNYSKALEHFMKSLKLREELNDKRGIASSFEGIGSTHYKLGKHQKALTYYLKSLKLRQEIKDKLGIASSYQNIGNCYEGLNNYQKAQEYIQNSLKIYEEIGGKKQTANTMLNLGIVFERSGKFNKALENYLESLKLYQEIGDKSGAAFSSNNIGNLYRKLKKYNQALFYLKKGLNLAKELNKTSQLKSSYQKLSELFATKGNYKKALDYHKLYLLKYTELNNENSNKKIAELQALYELGKKEKEIQFLKNNATIQKLTISRQKTQRNLLFVIIVLFMVIFIQFLRKYRYLFTFWKKSVHIGHYKLIDKIATGGMGSVYKAQDILDKTGIYALKLMREEFSKDDTQKRRFKNEALIIDQLDHPNIINIIDRGEKDGQMFMVMEYLSGITLSRLMEEKKQLKFSTIFNIMSQITSALIKVHSKNIIHRDLKPENIMLIEKEGNPYFVKLLDFGISKSQTLTRLTQSGMLLGTLKYLSPEQVSYSELTVASDIFSLGIIFYEMLSGENPFSGETTMEVVKQILDKSPVELKKIRPDISLETEELIFKMLIKNPKNRPPIEEVFKTINYLAQHSHHQKQ